MATTPLNSTTVIADDTNPALVYSGVWVRGGTPSEFNDTTHGSTQRGSSVQFTFKGTSVAVYGTIGTDTPTSTYLLDDSTPSVFVADKYKSPMYQQLFFHSPTLTDAEHTLLVTNLGSGELWIDYILYTQSSPPQHASSSTSSSLPPSTTPSLRSTPTSRTISLTTSQTSDLGTPTPSPPTSSETNSSTGLPDQVNSNARSSIPAPAVAGGAIGALVLIIVLVFGLLYYRRRAKRLAGEKLLEKNNIFGDPPESNKANPSAPITPHPSTYASSFHPSIGYRNPNMDPTGAVYPPLDYGYQNQSQPSTPIYHFSNRYPLGSGYSASSENITGVGTGPGYDGGSQPINQPDYFPNPHPQYSGGERRPHASSDRLVIQEHRNSLESAESHTSLAYLSSHRVAMIPSLPLPDALPGPPPTQATAYRSEKGGFVVHNPEVRQHEDSGVRLDTQQPQDTGSQQQVVDIPPVYKPIY